MARIKDIAKVAGVSEGSVRKALLGTGGTARISKATSQKILKVANEMQYRPNIIARQLAGAKCNLIGVIVDSTTPEVLFTRLPAIEQEATRFGYRLMVGQTHGEADRICEYIRDFSGRGIAGMIYLSHGYSDSKFGKAIADNMIYMKHIVFVGRPNEEGSSIQYWVDVDRAKGIDLAVEHLFDRGRKKIGLLLKDSTNNTILQRYEGYCRAMDRYGEAVDLNLVRYAGKPGNNDPGMILNHVKALVNEHGADAIIALNDHIAFLVINQLREMGLRVPEDICVVGFDNVETSGLFYPALTTVDHNLSQLARESVNMLVDLMEDRNVEEREKTKYVIVSPSLVIRKST